MCIILYKPAGVELPALEELRRLYAANPDGAGFMFPRGDSVVIRKGFMTFDSLAAALPRDKNAPLVVHMRIATHGAVKPANCHPFPLTSSARALERLECLASIGIAHNGIIDMCAGNYGESDTKTFIREYAAPIVGACGLRRWVLDMLEECASGSRLAIMTANGRVERLGTWYEHKGIYYSNKGYERKPRGYYSDYYAGYYDGFGDYYGYSGKWTRGAARQDYRASKGEQEPRAVDYTALVDEFRGRGIDTEEA